ncbi:MAG: dihydrofolate reductase [Phaeodactylibacter sp.]|nr:dihydrofolate reductase [Phaeodactylibacter sp.]
MTVSAILAADRNLTIGKDNDIPWHLPADLKYFKRRTLNHHVIMGRKTFESIGIPLPKRTNIVISRNSFFIASNCLVARSVEEALAMAYDNGEDEAFIIGGGEIYRLSMPYLDRIYLTEVATETIGGQVFFPELNPEEWALISSEPHEPDEKNAFAYIFKVYERIKPPMGKSE